MAAGSQSGVASGMADSQPQGLSGAVHSLVEGTPAPAVSAVQLTLSVTGTLAGTLFWWRML